MDEKRSKTNQYVLPRVAWPRQSGEVKKGGNRGSKHRGNEKEGRARNHNKRRKAYLNAQVLELQALLPSKKQDGSSAEGRTKNGNPSVRNRADEATEEQKRK